MTFTAALYLKLTSSLEALVMDMLEYFEIEVAHGSGDDGYTYRFTDLAGQFESRLYAADDTGYDYRLEVDAQDSAVEIAQHIFAALKSTGHYGLILTAGDGTVIAQADPGDHE
jgi:hypothetical protein